MTANILHPRFTNLLGTFASSNILLAFDFDGVLAPVVANRSRARVAGTTRRLFAEVARRYPCVVVSGRKLDDLQPRLTGIPLRAVFGNFGYEPAEPGGRPPARVRRWACELERRLAPVTGVAIEDKGYSLAVHYRHATDVERARRAIARVVTELRGARVLEGTLAATIMPGRRIHKGSALQAARRTLGCRTALYVGDDGTDEDAFASAAPDRLLSIRVGRARRTNAHYHLERQCDVNLLLERLLDSRRAVTSTP